MKIKDVFEKSIQFFKEKKIETPRLDAEILISYVLKIPRVQIYVRYEQPLSENEIEDCRQVVKRRATGEPVAYIVGEKGFFGLNFFVGPGVLIPRPETEMLVEEALTYIKEKKIQNPTILDIGAGTGCIGFSILKNCSGAKLSAIEKSENAAVYFNKNLENFDLQSRTKFYLNDVIQVDLSSAELFDIIVANPPYIDSADPLIQDSVKKFEPKEALFSEEQGFKDLFAWMRKIKSSLKPKGLLLFEMGAYQATKVEKNFRDENYFSEITILKDLSGLDRIIKCIR